MTVPFDCPRCGVVLTMSERQGVEIDYCPQCRGVWLDRGEIDKIVERSATVAPAASGWAEPAPAGPPPAAGWAPAPYPSVQGGHGKHGGHGGGYRSGHGRRKSWLGEIFD